MKSIGEALREIVPCFEPIGYERKPLLAAAGRVLGEDVLARSNLPAFDNSAMDGYAVRFCDLTQGVVLPVQGESRAGGATPSPLGPLAAMRIFTGAPMPDGADTVVMQENTQTSPGRVQIDELPTPGAHVRKRASDMARGSVALARGQCLGPGEVGLLAAQGRHTVSVYARPRVAIVSTGDELREIGENDAPGTIVGSNAYALAAQVLETGAEPWVLPTVVDRIDDIVEGLEQALRADVVLCTGGVSVGDYDLLGQALARAGIAVKLWKVAIKPGKPLMFAAAGRVPLLCLPGNPVSAMVTFEIFVKPGLRRMLGYAAPYPALIDVELEHDHRHATGRVELARAIVTRSEHGRLLVRMHPRQGSGSLPSMCGVDVLVVLDGSIEQFARGTILRALPMRPERGQREAPFT
jgi:molybdopterin molybdotransferase